MFAFIYFLLRYNLINATYVLYEAVASASDSEIAGRNAFPFFFLRQNELIDYVLNTSIKYLSEMFSHLILVDSITSLSM